MLQTAIEAAHLAGQIIAERYPNQRSITIKGYRDIVTEVDTAAESAIIDLVCRRFPNHAILSEEAGKYNEQAHVDFTWVIDPLDGTTNYAHRIPFFCTSVAVLKHGDPIACAVYDPLRDRTFAAEKGGGSTSNGKPMHVSQTSLLRHAILAFDWGHSNEIRTRMIKLLQHLTLQCGTVRGLGSAALALAYVASGQLDGYFHLAIKPWDVAAGMLLIKEAGGKCTTLKGAPYQTDTAGCLTTNSIIHSELEALTVTI
jgi:myo-inositol-1(or 4)-monophosphatase